MFMYLSDFLKLCMQRAETRAIDRGHLAASSPVQLHSLLRRPWFSSWSWAVFAFGVITGSWLTLVFIVFSTLWQQ